ncbi:MAG: PspC domain-containing protein [Bacteroidales bacterium]|nr:PspC domain-containing protein [Bacteroidales bacterium]
MEEKKLRKSTNKRLDGVCGGFAEYFNFDPTLVRAIYAILTFASSAFPGIIIYIACMLIMSDPEPKDTDITKI